MVTKMSIMMDETQNRTNELAETRHSSLPPAKLMQPKSFRPVSVRPIQILCTQLYTYVFQVLTLMQGYKPDSLMYIPFKPICVYIYIYIYIYSLFLDHSHPPWFDHPISPWREATLWNLLVSFDFFPLKRRYFPQHPILQYFQLCSSRNKRDRFLCSQKTQASLNFVFWNRKRRDEKFWT